MTGTVADDNIATIDVIPADGNFTANNDKTNYSVVGHFGTLRINADGSWTYTVTQGDPARRT